MKFYALLVALCLALVAVVRSEDAIDEKDVGRC